MYCWGAVLGVCYVGVDGQGGAAGRGDQLAGVGQDEVRDVEVVVVAAGPPGVVHANV